MHLKQNDPRELLETSEPKTVIQRSQVKFTVLIAAVLVMIVTVVGAGLIPRFRHQTELRARDARTFRSCCNRRDAKAGPTRIGPLSAR